MPSERNSQLDAELGHILFIDLIGYSKLTTHAQHESLHKLSQVLRNTEAFRAGEAEDNLLQLSTGTGFALAFANVPDAPVRCAMQLSKGLRTCPELKVRMGIHSGPVSRIIGINDKLSVAGAGLNTARHITDCGDAGHILLSKRAVEHLADCWHVQVHLRDLGEFETMSGETISTANLYTDEIGNPATPGKFKRRATKLPGVHETVRLSPIPAQNTLLTILFFFVITMAMGYWIFFPPAGSSIAQSPTGPQVQVPTSSSKTGDRRGRENHPTPSHRLATDQ